MIVELIKRITCEIVRMEKLSEEASGNDMNTEYLEYQIMGLKIALEITQELIDERSSNTREKS